MAYGALMSRAFLKDMADSVTVVTSDSLVGTGCAWRWVSRCTSIRGGLRFNIRWGFCGFPLCFTFIDGGLGERVE